MFQKFSLRNPIFFTKKAHKKEKIAGTADSKHLRLNV